jgi:hypothetical protein
MCHVVLMPWQFPRTYTGGTSLWEVLAPEGQNCNLIPVLTEKEVDEIKV